ncbi:MAG: S9 family peptidase [Xanthomonadales bacterium]|nr:S9 family peptidase [Xanthomonadales bacterium]NNL95147.1 S9 family peptidase [Xanthomonadales bacterium]
MKLKRLIVIAALMLSLVGQGAFAASKGLEHYFKKPQYAGFQISPNGEEMAALVPVEGRMNIVIIDLETNQPRIVTGETSQDVNGFMWASNERLLYFMDKDGSESFGIFAVNADGSKWRMLVEPAALRIANGAAVIRFNQVIDRLKDDPEHVLVSSNQRRAEFPDVYRLNIFNGRKRMVQRNTGNVQGWFVDYDSEIVGAGYSDDLYQGFMMLNKETGEFEELTRARYDEHSFAPVGIKGNGDQGWVSSYITPDGKPRDKAAIYEYNFKTRKFGELVFEHPRVDVTNVITSNKSRDIIGVNYIVGEPETVYVDPKWKAVMAGINAALPETKNQITSTDEDETIGVVAAFSSTQPVKYYMYDFAGNTMKFLAESRPWVEPGEMAEIRSVEFEASDGLLLQGYLTLPPGSDGKNLPTVVHPHGGPWARDGWGYNPAIQFLASRGYAVLQVNFRGSTGFGMEHWLASKKQWGQKMQSDVTEALNWAVEQGYSDPDRVCIYGGSYGGYATMAGLTFTPDLYKCGINYVGVTDIPLLFKTAPDSWAAGINQMKELVGDPKEDREFLEQWSPTNHADKIKAPVFMAYGEKDPRVHIDHAKIMEKELKKHGVEYELMIKEDEGHGYAKQENQYDFYGRMESFLAEHLNP